MNQPDMSSPRPIRAAGGLLWRKKDGNYEIAIIQRPRYDDWSLPKGKLHDGETWLQAAVREVKEETGYTAQPLSFAGAVSYVTANRPKVVCFWHMLAVGEPDSRMEDEVSEVIWLPLEAARDRLEYPLEKALLEIWEAPGAYRN